MFDVARSIEEAGLGSSQDFLKIAQTRNWAHWWQILILKPDRWKAIFILRRTNSRERNRSRTWRPPW